jgi:transposase
MRGSAAAVDAVVPVKTEEHQSALMLHRSRDLLVRQRTMLINALRGDIWLSSASSLRKGAATSLC